MTELRIESRVTWVAPGSACLLCRSRIDPGMARAESLSEAVPHHDYESSYDSFIIAVAESLSEAVRDERQEGYIPAINEPQPAVIAYTTTISGMAVSELLSRMFGLGNPDATETLLKLEVPKLSFNNQKARCGCWCASDKLQHRQTLLGLSWPSTKSTPAS